MTTKSQEITEVIKDNNIYAVPCTGQYLVFEVHKGENQECIMSAAFIKIKWAESMSKFWTKLSLLTRNYQMMCQDIFVALGTYSPTALRFLVWPKTSGLKLQPLQARLPNVELHSQCLKLG